MQEAEETKQRYGTEVMEGKIDPNLNVSYWFRYQGKPHVFVTTEKELTKNSFENDNQSLIGCGFVAPSKIVEWRKERKTRVFGDNGSEIESHGCVMEPRVERINAIVCNSYQPSGDPSPDVTVGVCIFTASDAPILLKNYHEFVQRRTVDFFNQFYEAIKNKEMTALAERSKS